MPLSFGGNMGFIMGVWTGIGRADICVRIFQYTRLRVDNDGYSKVQQTTQGPFAARFYGIMLVDLPIFWSPTLTSSHQLPIGNISASRK